jgi:hypothetical protein
MRNTLARQTGARRRIDSIYRMAEWGRADVVTRRPGRAFRIEGSPGGVEVRAWFTRDFWLVTVVRVAAWSAEVEAWLRARLEQSGTAIADLLLVDWRLLRVASRMSALTGRSFSIWRPTTPALRPRPMSLLGHRVARRGARRSAPERLLAS